VSDEAWALRQGRLVITYDVVKKRWYAHVSVEVLPERRGAGCGFMGIDLGRERLVTAVTSDGTALLYKGRRAEELTTSTSRGG